MKSKGICILFFVTCVSIVSGSTVSIVGGDGITFVNGQFYMEEFSTATVNIVSDFPVSKFHVGAIVALNATSIDDGLIHADLIGASGQVQNYNGTPWITGMEGNAEPPIVPGEVLYSFKVTSGVAGTIIDVYDFTGANPFGGMPSAPLYTSINDGVVTDLEDMSINVIPEPMTIGLLGLGAILIRRCK